MITHDGECHCQANDRFSRILSLLDKGGQGAIPNLHALIPRRRSNTSSRSGRRNEVIAWEARDAEVSAQMQHIEWTQIAGEGDQVEVRRTLKEDYCTSCPHVMKADPEVGCAISRSRVAGHQVLPPHGGVLPFDRLQQPRIIHAGRCIVVAMHGDAVQPAHRSSKLGVAGAFPQAAGQLQHRAVEGEICMEGSGTAERFHALRNPIERVA